MAAPTRAPTPQRTISAPVVLYWCAFFGVGLSLAILGPALSELRERSGADIGEIGVLFVAGAVGYVVGSLAGGRLFDRFPGHRVLAAFLTILAAGLFAVPWLNTVPALFVAFAVTGIGASVADVGSNALLIWELGADSGRALNVLHLMFGLGSLAAPLLVYGGVDLAVRFAAISSLAVALAALRVRSPHAPPAEHQQVANPQPRLLILLSAFFLFYVGLEVGYSGWIPTYAEEIGFSTSRVAWLTATFWIGFTAGRLVASAIAHRFRPRGILVGALALTVVAVVVVVAGGGATVPVWFGTALMGVAFAPQFPVMMSYLERRIHLTGYITSWFIAAAGLGGLVFPWAIGRWIGASGEAVLPWSMALLTIATIAAFALIDRRLES